MVSWGVGGLGRLALGSAVLFLTPIESNLLILLSPNHSIYIICVRQYDSQNLIRHIWHAIISY